MSALSKRQLIQDYQFLLSLLEPWMSGDDDPTAAEAVAIGGWDQVEATRKRVSEIRENLQTIIKYEP